MYKKYTALYLVVLVAAVQANSINLLKVAQQSNLLKNGRNWEDLGLTANVNDYVDETLSMVIPFIQEQGLDPMSLPDVEEGFEVRPILITYSARLAIHGGSMSGLVNVERSGDQVVSYFARMLRVRVQLRFTNLEIVYKYLVKVMNIGPTGGIAASLANFNIVFDVLFDFNNDEIQLQEFKLTDTARPQVRLTGNVLIDWLINPVLNVFLRIFDNNIMNVVQNNIRSAIQSGIDSINSNLKEIIQRLESFN